MKKYICILLGCLILFIASTANAATPQKVNVKIDGVTQSFTQPAVIISGSVMVPMRPIFEKLGAKIIWNAGTQTVTATKEEISVKLIINKQTAHVNGKEVKLTAKPVILNGSTLVPLRFVSESLGGAVHWNNATKTASINTTGEASGVTDLSAIKQFALKGTTEITQSVKAGDSANLIYSMFGKPVDDYQYRVHQFVDYEIGGHYVTFGYLGEANQDTGDNNIIIDTTVIDFIGVVLNQEFTYAEIISVFGEPLYDVFDHIPAKTQIAYELGDYKLFFTTSETTSPDQELTESITFNQITVREK